MAKGYVHSIEAGGLVDGPGVRYVVFLSGCLLRCSYCHNPDSWDLARGGEIAADELVTRIARTVPFLRASNGGVTLSGGEPLAQSRFALSVLRGAKALGLHTALDTSGYLGSRATDELLLATDLVLLDIKSFDPDTYRALTGVEIAPTLAFARRLAERGTPVWVRFVLVPGVTDDPDNMRGLAGFAAGLANVERVEVLPFHQHGAHKWRRLGIPYSLEHTPIPTAEEVQAAGEIFRAVGLRVCSDDTGELPDRIRGERKSA